MRKTNSKYSNESTYFIKLIQIVSMFILFVTIKINGQDNENLVSQKSFNYEIETQVPCFIVGGFHLSVGGRYENLRVRAEIQNSGTMDFGQFGLHNQNKNSHRYLDNISVGVAGDYFFYKGFFVSGSIETRNWKINDEDKTSEKHIRTIDLGIGPGFQYLFWEHLYFQISFGINFRQGKKLDFNNSEFQISNVDILPMLRLGWQF